MDILRIQDGNLLLQLPEGRKFLVGRDGETPQENKYNLRSVYVPEYYLSNTYIFHDDIEHEEEKLDENLTQPMFPTFVKVKLVTAEITNAVISFEGYDQDGNAIEDSLTIDSAETLYTAKAFKRISKITHDSESTLHFEIGGESAIVLPSDCVAVLSVVCEGVAMTDIRSVATAITPMFFELSTGEHVIRLLGDVPTSCAMTIVYIAEI